MYIYLPIAEISVNIWAVLALGGFTGILSGMFGVGGGFILTPLLIFMGISPAVAVSSSANQIVASSVSGFIAHFRQRRVDFRMGLYLLGGGVIGSTLGVFLFAWLKNAGQIDLIISIAFVFFLGSIGVLMLLESVREHRRKPARKKRGLREKLKARLPWKIDFPHSNLHISVLLPVFIGMLVGVLVSILGIGGGFFLIAAMIYILGMPASLVTGTSLFQIIFITANVTLLQALKTQTVDIVLAMLLLVGSALGAQVGARLSSRLPANYMRLMMAVLVLAVSLKLAYGLIAPPAEPFTVEAVDAF